MINSVLKLKCHNYKAGCSEELSYSEMIEHERKCTSCGACSDIYTANNGAELFKLPEQIPEP
jgi:hypothetical protein